MPLDLPDGSDVFVDANIFVYHFSGPTEYTDSCTAFLQRIEEGKVSGSTSSLVLAETLHRLMIIEAASALRLEPKAAIRHLKAHSEDAKTLTSHHVAVETIQALGFHILPLSMDDILHSNDLKKAFGLLTNDAINLAIMRRRRLQHIATNDPDFERIPELRVWKPLRTPK